MFIQKSDVRNLGKSFVCAFKGIAYCLQNERNMRIHFCVTVLVALFAYYYKATGIECIVLFLCIGFVITGEMVNTAIETLVNLESPSYNHLARIAKDVAAGAVFVAAVVSVIVGGFIFLQRERIITALERIITDPIAIILFTVVLVLGLVFIFNGPHLFGEKTMRIYKINNKKK